MEPIYLEDVYIRSDRTITKVKCPSGKIVYWYNDQGLYQSIFGIKKEYASIDDLVKETHLESQEADKTFEHNEKREYYADFEERIHNYLCTL